MLKPKALHHSALASVVCTSLAETQLSPVMETCGDAQSLLARQSRESPNPSQPSDV